MFPEVQSLSKPLVSRLFWITWLVKALPLSSDSSPGPVVRSTPWGWTTSCRSWASTTPGLRSPSGCRGAWWTRWTRCCQCSSRSWAPPCRTRRRRRGGTKTNTEGHKHSETFCEGHNHCTPVSLYTTVQSTHHLTCSTPWISASLFTVVRAAGGSDWSIFASMLFSVCFGRRSTLWTVWLL